MSANQQLTATGLFARVWADAKTISLVDPYAAEEGTPLVFGHKALERTYPLPEEEEDPADSPNRRGDQPPQKKIVYPGCVAFSPNNRYIAFVAKPNQLVVWDLAFGGAPAVATCDDVIPRDETPVAISFDRDGDRIFVLSSGKRLMQYSVAQRGLIAEQVLEEVKGKTLRVGTASFAPLSSRLAICTSSLTVWSTEDSEPSLIREIDVRGASSISVSPDGVLIAAGMANGEVIVVSAADGRARPALAGPRKQAARHVRWSQNSTHLCVQYASEVWMWGIGGSRDQKPVVSYPERNSHGAVVSPCARMLASVDEDGVVGLRPTAGEARLPLSGGCLGGNSISFSADGQYLAYLTEEDALVLWYIGFGAEVKRLETTTTFENDGLCTKDQERKVTVSTFSLAVPDAITFSCTDDRRAQHRAAISSATVFAADGSVVATGADDGTVRVWTFAKPVPSDSDESEQEDSEVDAGSMEPRVAGQRLDGSHCGAITALGFATDGSQLVSGCVGGRVSLWTLDGSSRQELLGHEGAVTFACIAPTGRFVLAACDDAAAKEETRRVIIWDTAAGSRILMRGQPPAVACAAFSPMGAYAVTGSWSDMAPTVFHLPSGECLGSLDGHNGAVMHAAFAADEKHFVSTAQDNTAIVWGVADGRIAFGPVPLHDGSPITSLAMTGSNLYAFGHADGSVTLHEFVARPRVVMSSNQTTAPPHVHAITTLAISGTLANGAVVSCDANGVVAHWGLHKESKPTVAVVDRGAGPGNAAGFGPNGAFFAVGAGREVSLFSSTTGENIFSIETTMRVAAVMPSLRGEHVVCTSATESISLMIVDGEGAASEVTGMAAVAAMQ